MAERKIHVKSPAGYTNQGTFEPGEVTLRYATNRYKRDGYQIATVDAINGYNQRFSVLFVKAPNAVKAKVSRKVTVKHTPVKAVRSVRTTKAKKFTKAIIVSGKRILSIQHLDLKKIRHKLCKLREIKLLLSNSHKINLY